MPRRVKLEFIQGLGFFVTPALLGGPQDTMIAGSSMGGLISRLLTVDSGDGCFWKLANAEPLALIEYWAVDPDYDGKVFRSVWQDYRGNTANDADALRVVTQACVTVPRKDGTRRVCVRVVDVFGFEAEVVSSVGVV